MSNVRRRWNYLCDHGEVSTTAVAGSILSCSDCVRFPTPGSHKWLAGVVFLAAIVGVVALVALAQMALSSIGRRRWGLVLCMASVMLVFPSAAAVLVGVDNVGSTAPGADFIDCGRPLLSRSDLDAASSTATVSNAAAYCQHELANRRTLALAALISALAAATGAVFLLVPLRSGHGLRRSRSLERSAPLRCT